MVVAQKWSLFRGWSFKITINIEKLGITLAVIDRCLEVVVNTGLTVLINKILKFVSYNFFYKFQVETEVVDDEEQHVVTAGAIVTVTLVLTRK